MSRWDVQVLGIETGRAIDVVADAVAKHLGAEAGQVQRLLAHAPTTLVADLDDASAKALVAELRTMGLRVKPRPSGSAPTELTGPPSNMPPPPTERVGDERATAPTLSLPVPETRASEREARLSATPPASGRSPLENLSTRALSRPSGLELEDVPLPRPSARPPPGALHEPRALPSRPPPAAAPASSRPPPPTAPPVDEAPRAFWSALPGAFLVPLRGPVLPALLIAPLFVGIAVLFVMFGFFVALAGALVMSAAYLGTVLQVSHRCLWATATGERVPAPLPGDFLAEYAFPGVGMMVVQGVLGAGVGWLSAQAVAHGVSPALLQAGSVVLGLYGVIGFALAAASRSAFAFFDAPRILRILVRAPLQVLVIGAIGGVVQGGALALAAVQLGAGALTGSAGAALFTLAGALYVVSFAAAYGAALTATMMGMLFWARPDVANEG